MAKFICVTNSIFNSYPMNNGDNVWEPGFRVGEKGEISENMSYIGGNRGKFWWENLFVTQITYLTPITTP